MGDIHKPFSELSHSVIKAMAYYDLFNYPLTPSEIFSSLPTNHVTLRDVLSELKSLESQSMIYNLGSFYSLQNDLNLEKKRSEGNKLANELMAVAAQQAQLIGSFPFVRSVMISGSLSKGYADAQSDIDFFIITRPGRLWIARTLLVVYKRLFLSNSHKFFCVNYFIDTEHLEIEEKNVFTATELSTLIPLYGHPVHADLLQKNSWLKNFFPNFQSKIETRASRNDSGLKKILERVFNVFFPSVLDRFFMRLTLSRWRKIYRQAYSPEDFELAFRTHRHVSKNHPQNYQKRIVARYEERVRSLQSSMI